jgi:NAD(P)-dependent dehydrogenase (short-subunit alcohol dehydrogenase family)
MSTMASDVPSSNKPSTSVDPSQEPPSGEGEIMRKKEAAISIGTTKRLAEFSLADRVVLVTGAARGLGLTQAEALLEAGATVYALDVLPEPSPDFPVVQKRAADELGTSLHYRQVDVRDNAELNKTVKEIADAEGRMDGLIAAAGIQKETPALEYTQEDANHMFSVNITGVFMTAQAVARQMIRFKKGGSIVLIGSMSAHVANRV